jgi:hypothetical protein
MIEHFTLIVKIAIPVTGIANSRLFPVPGFIFPFSGKKFPVRPPREFAGNPLSKLRILTSDKALAAGAGEIPGYFAGSREAAPRSAESETSPASNICTEELVLLCEQMGIDSGVELNARIEVGHMAEETVGHQLPSELIHTGSLDAFRRRAAA